MKMMIVLRKDLNMRKGKMIAQGAHAAVELTLSVPAKKLMDWRREGAKKIAVSVKDEAELLEIYQQACQVDLHAVMIIDAGHTEFNGVPTKTCIAIGPDDEEKIDQITQHLALL